MKETKHIRRDFHSVARVMPQRYWSKKFKHGHVAYQMDGDDEQNRMQVKFLSYGQTGDLGVRSKGQISSNFGYHVNFKQFLYQTFCVFPQIKDRKT